MLNLIRAEWLKLTKRPLTWVLLAVFLGLMVLNLAVEFLVVALHDGAFSGGSAQIKLLPEEQVTQFRLMVTFPGIFGAVLGQVNGVGGICAVVLAAGAFGSEYSWGTLRTQLARQPRRGTYLIAKLITLHLILLDGMVVAMLVGSLLAGLFGWLLGHPGNAQLGAFLALPLGMFRSLYVIMPYVMFTVACCTFGRSVLAGVLGGMLFLIIDVGVGTFSFLSDSSGVLALVYRFIPQPNINTLIVMNSRSFDLDPALLMRSLDLGKLPSPFQATLVIAAYSALSFLYAYRALVARDIGGPG
jgi:ABC-2 type transport system permease protein